MDRRYTGAIADGSPEWPLIRTTCLPGSFTAIASKSEEFQGFLSFTALKLRFAGCAITMFRAKTQETLGDGCVLAQLNPVKKDSQTLVEIERSLERRRQNRQF